MQLRFGLWRHLGCAAPWKCWRHGSEGPDATPNALALSNPSDTSCFFCLEEFLLFGEDVCCSFLLRCVPYCVGLSVIVRRCAVLGRAPFSGCVPYSGRVLLSDHSREKLVMQWHLPAVRSKTPEQTSFNGILHRSGALCGPSTGGHLGGGITSAPCKTGKIAHFPNVLLACRLCTFCVRGIHPETCGASEVIFDSH